MGGYSEEEANDVYEAENVEVYHMKNHSGQEMSNTLYFKVIVIPSEKNKIVGFHYCGPNAGEVMQGFALALRVGCTKEDLDDLVGIHPTCAEWFTTLKVTKRSGAAA